MTLDKLYTITTVEFNDKFEKNEVIIDDRKITGEEYQRISIQLEILKQNTNSPDFAKIVSKSNFPKKAGLASSASGFAALTLAGTEALELKLGKKELSILAR